MLGFQGKSRKHHAETTEPSGKFGYKDLSGRPNLINLRRGAGGPPNEIIYEYRSGLLIPGSLDGYGNFVPKNKGEIIDFKDYKRVQGGPDIWNFPGKLGTEERDVKP